MGDERARRAGLALAAALLTLAGCSASAAPADAGLDAATSDAPLASDAGADDAAEDAPGPDAAAPLRVLFLGNSLTYVNDLPSVVQALGAATPGAAVEVDEVVMGSATLIGLWSGTDAPDRVAHGGFAALVLQGQSAETFVDPSGFAAGAMLFGDAARDAGALPVWFATWALGAEDPTSTSLGAPSDTTRRIEDAYATAASTNGGVVARVGAAWQLAAVEVPGVALHGGDGLHPTPAGTLLAACVILETLTGQTPRVPDPPPLGIARETAEALCALASRVACDEGQFVCDAGCRDLQSDFTHCGHCDVACAGVDPCIGGHCGCPAPLSPCDRARCVALDRDVTSCGACGVACPTGGVCTSGTCSCPAAAASRVSDPAVMPLPSECATFGAVPTAECDAAVHVRCSALDCFQSGFGPTLVGGTGLATVCLAGEVRTTSFTELAAIVPACDGTTERAGPACTTAISRYCAAAGAVSGFGPVGGAGDEAMVTCLSDATIVHTTFTTLALSAPGCDGTSERWGFECGWAASFFCQSLGHLTGFGPVEATGDDADVVCVDG